MVKKILYIINNINLLKNNNNINRIMMPINHRKMEVLLNYQLHHNKKINYQMIVKTIIMNNIYINKKFFKSTLLYLEMIVMNSILKVLYLVPIFYCFIQLLHLLV